MPRFQKQFIEGGRFTAGLTVQYDPSTLTGGSTWQNLAEGFPVGARFHSAPVIRLADAKPMQLGHTIEAGLRWTIFAFSPQQDTAIRDLCDYLGNNPQSPLHTYRRDGDDIDTLIDVRAIYQQGFRELAFESMPALLRPAKGRYGLTDYEKVFCADVKNGDDVFDMRGIDRTQGCMIVVRPDQYVAQILPLAEHDALTAFFAGVFQPATAE